MTGEQVQVREQGGDPAFRYYATLGGFGAASWSPEAAIARARLMQEAARQAERRPSA